MKSAEFHRSCFISAAIKLKILFSYRKPSSKFEHVALLNNILVTVFTMSELQLITHPVLFLFSTTFVFKFYSASLCLQKVSPLV